MNCDDQARPSWHHKTGGAKEKANDSEKSEMGAIATQTGESKCGAEQPRLPEEIQNRIGEHLRTMYNQIAEEPVPEHLLKLLKRLESKE